MNDPLLLDGFSQSWSPEAIRRHLTRIVDDIRAQGTSGPSTLRIVTFDDCGVSGHPNHVDTFKGVAAFARAYRQQGRSCDSLNPDLEVYVLRSPGLPGKYLGPLGALAEYYLSKSTSIVAPSISICANALAVHTSQMVWYRRAFARLATCAYINRLEMLAL